MVLADHGPVQESTDDAYIGGEVTTLSAKAAGFIQTVTVADNPIRQDGRSAVKAGGSRLRAAAELARAKYDLDRYRTLRTDQFASRQRFEQADADHEKARAAERGARAALDAAERQLDVIATQKQQTQAALDQALAERDLALLNLAYTEVRSPIDGVVGNRSARRRLCHGRSPAPRNRPRARPLG